MIVQRPFGPPEPATRRVLTCPLCGARRDHFTLQASHGWWRMSLTADPSVWVGHEFGEGAYQTDRYHICRLGHIWPAAVSAVTIYRMLGTTAAGKTMLLRNMARQTVPHIRFASAPELCNRRFDNDPHTAPTGTDTLTHRLHLTDFLGRYGASSDELTDLLTRSGFTKNENDEFGADAHLPFHLLVDAGGQRRDTIFIDLSGEVMENIVEQRLTDPAVARLSHSDGVVWVIDAAVLPPVQQALESTGRERILLESLRPGLFVDEWRRNLTPAEVRNALNLAIEKSSRRYPLTEELAGVFARSTTLLDGNALRAVVLTKADLFPHLLSDGRGWEFLTPFEYDPDEFAVEFPAGGVDYLETLCSNPHQPFDAAAEEVVAWLRDSPTAQDRRGRCLAIARGVLDFYADPTRFKQLLLKREGSLLAAESVLHRIPCTTDDDVELVLRVGTMTADWGAYRTHRPRPLLMRDLVTAILVRCALGSTTMSDEIVAAEQASPVRYFMTGPMDAERQAANPHITIATGRSPGVLHLLAWIMA